MNSEIDFVLPWVDGTDLIWRKELDKYEISSPEMNSEDRFRDWGNLIYIFRGIEKFTLKLGKYISLLTDIYRSG